MLDKLALTLPNWKFLPIVLLVFVLPSVAVNINSGATTVFLLILIPSLFFCWGGWCNLYSEEKLLLVSFLIFVLFVGLSFTNNSDVSENISSYEEYLRFVAFIPIYLFVRNYSIELGPWLAWGVIVGCCVTGIFAMYQYHWLEIPRPHGARNIARFGIVSVIFFLILSLIVMFEWRKPKILSVCLVAAFFVLYAIILNHTRSAVLSIFPFLIMLLILSRNWISRKQGFMFSLGILFIAILFFHPSSPVAQHFVSGIGDLNALIEDPINNYASDWGIRPHMYYAGWLVFLDAPLFGTGINDYGVDAQSLMDSGKIFVQHFMIATSPHNIYINSLAETGLLGFLGLLSSVCIAPIYCYFKLAKRGVTNNKIRFYALSGLATSNCFLFFGLFHTWTSINNQISIFLLLHLVFLSSSYNSLSQYSKN